MYVNIAIKEFKMNKNDKFYELAGELVEKLTLSEKLSLLSTHHHAVPRLNMGEFYIGTEVARGFVGRDDEHYSTVFPQPIGMASTFDTELMSELGEIAGNECRAYYNEKKTSNLCVWGPTVDMERDPRWGRTEEAYGEDVFLAGEMTAAYTKSMAADNGTYLKTIPTLKHFCANNNELHRSSCNSVVPLRLKYEYYYAAFRNAIVNGGAKSIMTAYNEVNGIPALCNPEVQSILKDKWGLWFAVTDGEDFSQTVKAHKYCSSYSEALADAIKAGCDTMTDLDSTVHVAAEKALEKGLLTEEEIDASLRNTLYARFKLGQFADDCPYDSINKSIVDCDTSREVNLRAACEQMVLLKNDGLLPLKDPKGKLAVCGPLADENLRDWYTGTFRDAVSVKAGFEKEFPECEIISDSLWDIVSIKASNGKYLSVKEDGSIAADADTVSGSELFELQDWGENWINFFSVKYKRYADDLDGSLRLNNRTIFDWFTHETFNLKETENGIIIEEYLGHNRLTCGNDGELSYTGEKAVSDAVLFTVETVSRGEERAKKLASECSAVIYCTGNYPVQVAKECFDRESLKLNVQEGMAEKLHAANSNTVMLLISSYPYSICSENEKLPTVLWSSHAGAHLGTAAARTISGKNNPAARLPLTWYRSEHDLPDIMNYDIENGGTTYMYFKGKPLYPFGYGLSYSAFEYSGLTLSENADGGVSAELSVKNISDTDGDEVVQLYFTVKDSEVTRPIKKLCGFARVHIGAGETRTVRLEVPEHILRIYDIHSGKMIVEDSSYTFFAGASSQDIRLTAELHISGEKISLRGDSFEAQSFDKSNNLGISYSRKAAQHYIVPNGWDAFAVYGGVNFSGKTSVTLKVSAFVGDCEAELSAGDISFKMSIPSSDGKDDIGSFTAPLPHGLPDTGELRITLPGGLMLLEISLS